MTLSDGFNMAAIGHSPMKSHSSEIIIVISIFLQRHKSEVAGTILFTGAYPKQNR